MQSQVWGWEPLKNHDHVDVAWNQVTDMQAIWLLCIYLTLVKIVDDQLVACGHSQGFVAVWIAEMSQVSIELEQKFTLWF